MSSTTLNRIVEFYINEKKYFAREGTSVALALYNNNYKKIRKSPKLKTDRGLFCMMGSCQECIVNIDGVKKLSCISKIKKNTKIGGI